MSTFFRELLELCLTGPVWPASVLLGLLLAYSVLVFVGLADGGLDGPDVDADGFGDFADSTASLGLTTVRWLNLDAVPLFIWASAFSVLWWLISLLLWNQFDQHRYQATWIPSILLTVRNSVLALLCTKYATLPMRSLFERSTALGADALIGKTCEIDTSEATTQFGRAKYRTDGAPLLLNVRTSGETLTKGQRALLIDFDPETRIYTVQSAEASS